MSCVTDEAVSACDSRLVVESFIVGVSGWAESLWDILASCRGNISGVNEILWHGSSWLLATILSKGT